MSPRCAGSEVKEPRTNSLTQGVKWRELAKQVHCRSVLSVTKPGGEFVWEKGESGWVAGWAHGRGRLLPLPFQCLPAHQ